jgi:hypothetical protein
MPLLQTREPNSWAIEFEDEDEFERTIFYICAASQRGNENKILLLMP